MHELSIAESVIRIAIAHAAGRRVAKIELSVGHLRQVVPSALEFAFELASRGTSLEGAALDMREVPAAGRCSACGTDSALPEFPLHCSACGSLDVDVVRGEELMVEALELEEEMATTEA